MKNIPREAAMIAAIVSDHYMQQLYGKYSYIESLDIIADTAVKIEVETRPVKDWAAFCDQRNILCWDDYVVQLAGKMLTQFL